MGYLNSVKITSKIEIINILNVPSVIIISDNRNVNECRPLELMLSLATNLNNYRCNNQIRFPSEPTKTFHSLLITSTPHLIGSAVVNREHHGENAYLDAVKKPSTTTTLVVMPYL